MVRGIAFLLVLLISPAAYAQTTHTVGDTAGWNTNVNYVSWARGKTFTVGDSLVFNYDFTHGVDEVKDDDYTSCNTANANSSDSNSPTTIPLTAAGTRYFVCPRSNHCSQGMKLTVNVVAGTTTPSPPSGGATPSPPSVGATPSPPSEGATPSPPRSTPPPPAGSGAATLGGGKSFMVGLSLVMGTMLGVIMG